MCGVCVCVVCVCVCVCVCGGESGRVRWGERERECGGWGGGWGVCVGWVCGVCEREWVCGVCVCVV